MDCVLWEWCIFMNDVTVLEVLFDDFGLYFLIFIKMLMLKECNFYGIIGLLEILSCF